MFREAIMKLAGATLLLLGIGTLTIGFLMSDKFIEATGFMCGIVGLFLFYYTWRLSLGWPAEEEPGEDAHTVNKQKL